MSETDSQTDANFWRKHVQDAEFRATILDDADAAQVFDSFLWYWLQKCQSSKLKLYVVPRFSEYEFMITPDEEFYVSSNLGEIIQGICEQAAKRRARQLSTLIMTYN